mmetsp:Transcript_97059/g.257896  ORF Transcript_97059/g.257896 Transcript_97059/m.257896 type:complete len:222 (+) Transcript_97059:593-1258(+)
MAQERCPPVRVEDAIGPSLEGLDDVWLPQDVADVLPHRCLDGAHLAATVAVLKEGRTVAANELLATKVLRKPLKRPLLAGRPPSLRICQHDWLARSNALAHLTLGQAAALVDEAGAFDHNLAHLGWPREVVRRALATAQGRNVKPELGAQGVLRPSKKLVSWLGTQVRSPAPGHKASTPLRSALSSDWKLVSSQQDAAGISPREGVHVHNSDPLILATVAL